MSKTAIITCAIIIADAHFYMLGGYQRCCDGLPHFTPCVNGLGYLNKIWKFVANEQHSTANGGMVGTYVELNGTGNCRECKLKYGLTDVNTIWLPGYSKNSLYDDKGIALLTVIQFHLMF